MEKQKVSICKYCHQYLNKEEEIIWITSKKYIDKKKSWLSGYKSKTLDKYHKRCWKKIKKRIEKVENE